MNSRPAAPTLLLLAGALGLTGVLAGCGAGRYNQNFQEKAAIDPTNVDYGAIQVRNVALSAAADAGQAAVLTFSLYSRQVQDADALTSITIPSLAGEQPLELLKVAGGTSTPVRQIPIPTTASPGPATYAARITSLSAPIRPSTYVETVFTFARAGAQAPIDVPVRRLGDATGPTAVPTVIPDVPHPQPTAKAAGSPTPTGEVDPGTAYDDSSPNPTATPAN